MEKLYTVPEAAKVLRLASGTLYRWIIQRRLAVVRFSPRCVRISESELQTLSEKATCPAQIDASRASRSNTPPLKRVG
jgi:excisionase family DNA binding protein